MALVTKVTYNRLERILEEMLKEHSISFEEYNVIEGCCVLVKQRMKQQLNDQCGLGAAVALEKLLKTEGQ